MKKGITFGAFDLFHAGHVLMLEEAKSVCDHLTVCIQTDPSIDRKSKFPSSVIGGKTNTSTWLQICR